MISWIKKVGLKSITVKNIKSFIEGYFRSIVIKMYNKHFSYIEEQVKHRIDLVEAKSPECINNAECKTCKCKTPELFYSNKGCSNKENPCYGELKNKIDWIEYKIQNEICK